MRGPCRPVDRLAVIAERGEPGGGVPLVEAELGVDEVQFGEAHHHRAVFGSWMAATTFKEILGDITRYGGARCRRRGGRHCCARGGCCGGGRCGCRCGGRRTALGCHHARDLGTRQRAAKVRQRPAALHQIGRVLVHITHQEHALRERGHELVERAAVHAACARERALETFDDACLVALGLQAADEPGAAVGEAFVVEVDGVLRREYAAQSECACLLEQRQHRYLRGRVRGRREVAEDLIHVEDRAQAGGARLVAHP